MAFIFLKQVLMQHKVTNLCLLSWWRVGISATSNKPSVSSQSVQTFQSVIFLANAKVDLFSEPPQLCQFESSQWTIDKIHVILYLHALAPVQQLTLH